MGVDSLEWNRNPIPEGESFYNFTAMKEWKAEDKEEVDGADKQER